MFRTSRLPKTRTSTQNANPWLQNDGPNTKKPSTTSTMQQKKNKNMNMNKNTKAIYGSCSKGVSTEEIFGQKSTQKNNVNVNPTELTLETHSFSSHKSTTSTSTTLSDADVDNRNSKRFADGGDDPVGNEPLLSRNSMLFNLIACGGSGSFRKTLPPPLAVEEPCTVGRKSCSGGSLLLKGVVSKAAAGRVAVEEDEMMIRYMSENPRFGNLQSEEKEFFSGSIVEAMATEERVGADQPGLKKSSSYNQERSVITF
ncbi:protein UPSTREAM OF FLC [Sesamum angolense]|uniref:Protein UPSTREAM OF FLC n=1 Tax=Sesamum angolense TaxID=2727404 RepID=A0AAE2C795_9LAMI|nr:protein UPSTREAM OF FLC [Sesamum angolense]